VPTPSRSPHARPRGHRRLAALALVVVAMAAACGAPSAAPPATGLVAAGSPEVGGPSRSGAPDLAASAAPSDAAGPVASRRPLLVAPAYATRVVIPALSIDLPVISGDLQPPPSYPFCDVAAYVTRFGQPYETGVTYISAHAQKGMFLPLLEASRRADGRELIGTTASVYTSDGRRFDYTIERVQRHATDYALVAELPLDGRNLILQTSEGPFGTREKLQVAGTLTGEAAVDPAEANPTAAPRDCRPSELTGEEGPAEGPAAPSTRPEIVVAAPTPPVGAIPEPSALPGASPAASGALGAAHVASRVEVPALGIDLPVVSGDLQPPPNYPYCDVAAYVTFLAQPGEPGTTYLTAHAQEGMFLPLLDASLRKDGRELLGMEVRVSTSDALLYTYEIWEVRRHITDRAIATEGLVPGEQRLVLQTSEGPYGTPEKLAVAARLVAIERTDADAANPPARPRDCRPASGETGG
jgi:sortase (surface protein transpeptidase)